jgi:hypothetical protein
MKRFALAIAAGSLPSSMIVIDSACWLSCSAKLSNKVTMLW